MTKNVTISIPNDLANKMAKLTDVNWSGVCKECIHKYVERRLNPNIEAIISRLKEEKDEAYSEGYLEAINWAKKTSFEKLEEAVVGWKQEQKGVHDECYSEETPVTEEQFDTYLEQALDDARRNYWRGISDNDTAGKTFLQGFMDGVLEFYEKAK